MLMPSVIIVLSMTQNGLQLDDEIAHLHFLTQQTRARIIQDILAHPKQCVSAKELEFMNQNKRRATIIEQAEKLSERNIVEKVKLPTGERQRDLPSTFYRLTSEGEKLLEKHNLFIDDVEQLQETYAAVQKPEIIHEYENAPRPSKDSLGVETE